MFAALLYAAVVQRSGRPCTLPNSVIAKKREHTSANVALLLPKVEAKGKAKRKGKGKGKVVAAVLNVAPTIAMERVKMVTMVMLV